MVVPASMAMVRVRCCGFEIFYFFGLIFSFLFSFHPFFPLIASHRPFFSLSPSFAPRHGFLHILPWSRIPFPLCPKRKQRNSCLTLPECLAFAFKRVPHCLQRAEPAWGDRSHDLLFSWVLDCRDARRMQYCNWQLIS